jgi:MFS family permease
VPFGILLRRGLVETLPAGAAAAVEPVGRRLAWIAALGIAMLAGSTTATYVLDYLTTYATATLHMPTRIGFLATIAVGLTGVLADPIGGLLSDRFGRKPVMMLPWVVLLLVTLPGFVLLARLRTAGMLVGMAVVLEAATDIASAAVLVAVTESMPVRIRAGSLGVIYAVAISVFGGSTQFTVAWLTRLTHSPLAPAWYMTGCVAVSLVAMVVLPETAPGKRRRGAGWHEAGPTG